MNTKINYKLVNIALIFLIIFLIYITGNLWLGILNKLIKIFTPFLIAFSLSYAIYPTLIKLEENKLPKWLSITLIVFIILLIISIVLYLITTILSSQLSLLFSSIISFISKIDTTKLDFNLVNIESTLSLTFKNILTNFSTYVSNGAINIFNTSMSFLSNILIIFASFIYFLIDMDKIRLEVKSFIKKRSIKVFNYVKLLDNEMKNYLNGLMQVMFITLIEYTLAYLLIGHPNAILLGFLACICTFIPYFGGICVNIIASITAFVVSPKLLIITVITFVILSAIDSYIINPTVYGKTNSMHPLLTIIALFAGGIIFGLTGVFISFPLIIIIVSTYKYFKKDIKNNIKKVNI